MSLTRSILIVAASGVCALGAMVGPRSPAAAAEPGKIAATDLLFDRKHLSNVDAGADLDYRFQRTVSQPELLGQPFSDDIHVQVKKAGGDGTRDLVVKVFSGDRAREPQAIEGMTGNPILIVFLDRSIASYISIAGGNSAYLKDHFRTALRDKATVEPVKVMLGEKQVAGYKVTVTPYAGDINAPKMRGFENSKFAITVSDNVPGQFVEMEAIYESTDKTAPRLEERTQLVGAQVIP